jgi:site-specific DNA-adenine methylase
MRKPFMQMEAAERKIQNSYILHDKMPLCYPFVKWAGGKTQLLSQLYTLAPPEFDRYFEPFLGGGALFFYLISDKNKRFTDMNSELINSYIAVKDNVEKLIKFLKRHEHSFADPRQNLKDCSIGEFFKHYKINKLYLLHICYFNNLLSIC